MPDQSTSISSFRGIPCRCPDASSGAAAGPQANQSVSCRVACGAPYIPPMPRPPKSTTGPATPRPARGPRAASPASRLPPPAGGRRRHSGDAALGQRLRRGERAVSACPRAVSPSSPLAGRGVGVRGSNRHPSQASPPHPNPLPAKDGERGSSRLHPPGPAQHRPAVPQLRRHDGEPQCAARPPARALRARPPGAGAAADAGHPPAGVGRPARLHAAPAAAPREERGRHRLPHRVGPASRRATSPPPSPSWWPASASTSATRCCSASPARARPSPWPR